MIWTEPPPPMRRSPKLSASSLPPHERMSLEDLRLLDLLPSPEREAVVLHRAFGVPAWRVAVLLGLDRGEVRAFLDSNEARAATELPPVRVPTVPLPERAAPIEEEAGA